MSCSHGVMCHAVRVWCYQTGNIRATCHGVTCLADIVLMVWEHISFMVSRVMQSKCDLSCGHGMSMYHPVIKTCQVIMLCCIRSQSSCNIPWSHSVTCQAVLCHVTFKVYLPRVSSVRTFDPHVQMLIFVFPGSTRGQKQSPHIKCAYTSTNNTRSSFLLSNR